MIRLVDFCAQRQAEAELSRPDLAIISITDPGQFEARLPKVPHILRAEFHDVEAGDEPWVWFEENHATQIVTFVEQLQHLDAPPVDLLVHCKAGISRSSAVALYVHALTECDFPWISWQVSRYGPLRRR